LAESGNKKNDLTSLKDYAFSNTNEINSRIFPGEIQVEEVQDYEKNHEINGIEWETYKNKFEKNTQIQMNQKENFSNRIKENNVKN